MSEPSLRTTIREAIRSPIVTSSRRRIRAARGLAGVASPADRVAEASVVAARRNHWSVANSTWPNWWRIISCSMGGSGISPTSDST